MKILNVCIIAIVALGFVFVVINMGMGAVKTADYTESCVHVDNVFFKQHHFSGNTPFTSFKAGEYQVKGAILFCRTFNMFN
ncbi:hypothetical protein [Shewanella sp. 30m-9]